MRGSLLVLVLLGSHARADPPGLPDPVADATRMAMRARELARQGHCTDALRLRPVIEGLDAETARHAFADDHYLVWCATRTTPQPATLSTPTPLPSPVPAPVRAPDPCSNGGYFEPSLLATHDSTGTGVLSRVAAGALIRSCDRPMQLRVGASLLIGHIGGDPADLGVGGETEVAWTISDLSRLGGHLAVEHVSHGYLASADLRLHVDDVFWVQLGTYAGRHASASGAEIASVTGVAFGVGAEGTLGTGLGIVALCIGGLFVAVGGQGFASTH